MFVSDLMKYLPTEVRLHSCRVRLLVDYYIPDTYTTKRKVAYDVAYLHDLLEDTELTADDIKNVEVREAVVILTRKTDEPYFEYIQRIIDSDNEYAYFVKLADISDHLLQIETLKPSLKDRYEKALRMLKGI